MNYKIIKKLGHGMMGTVYLIEYTEIDRNKKIKLSNSNKYALKIEHIEKKDIKPNKKSEIWREINFYNNFAYKYPDQFVNLIEYDFIDNCNHKQKYSFDIELFSKEVQNKIIKKAQSPYCIRKVYELVDGTVNILMDKLDTKQIYSMCVQLAYSVKLLHQSNYVHGDIHSGNIGWVKTKKKYINCGGLMVKTFGYIYKLLDFGMVMNKSDISNREEKKYFNELIKSELANINYLLIKNNFVDWLNKNKIKYDFDIFTNELKKTDEFCIIEKFTSNWNDQIFLYQILFQDKYQQLICGFNYKKTIPIKLYLPKEDILFIIKIYSCSDLVIKYFYNKIK